MSKFNSGNSVMLIILITIIILFSLELGWILGIAIPLALAYHGNIK